MEHKLLVEEKNANTESKMEEEMEELLETICAASTFAQTSISRCCQSESNTHTPHLHDHNSLLGNIPSRSLQITMPNLCYMMRQSENYLYCNRMSDKHVQNDSSVAATNNTNEKVSKSCDGSSSLYGIDINELQEY